ncbi:TlpA family protein disulfide reductase [Candidatus Microthrix parvicella]|uniref:TlpA family protein disulfide reductase n=1 Tax=Candidatus Neomicrothrix parvicella TaxID=41950 RepID=UPI00035F40EC|nr:hypothetical protein [Candidatus Microthrix parvicella]
MEVLVGALSFGVVLLTAAVAVLARSQRQMLDAIPSPPHHVPGALGESVSAQRSAEELPQSPHDGDTADRQQYFLDGLDLNGSPITVAIDVSQPILLAFLTAGCSTCARFWDLFASESGVPNGVSLVVIAHGGDLDNAEQLRGLAAPHYPLLRSSDYWDDFDVPVGPHFVIVDPAMNQVVDEGRAVSATDLDHLLRRAGVGD